MADAGRFWCMRLTNAYSEEIAGKCDEMAEEGWRFVQAWACLDASKKQPLLDGADGIITFLLFEREQSMLSKRVEMAIEASNNDPLLDGGAIKWARERAQDG